MSADHSFMSGRFHQPNNRYVKDEYNSPVAGSPHDVSTPRSMVPMKNPMLGCPGRPTHMNTPSVVGSHPMSSVAYGFRPESGCVGVLFQIFLQGSLVANWQRQKEMAFWISFNRHAVPAVLHEVDSNVSLPEIGTKRYVLQSIVPPQPGRNRCPVTLTVNGLGGRSVVGGLFIGNFHYKPDDGSLNVYDYKGNHNALLRWLKETTPNNIDILTPVNEWELCDPGTQNTLDITKGMEELSLEQFPYPQQSQGLSRLVLSLIVDQDQFQFENDFQGQLWQTHASPGLLHAANQETQYDDETFYRQYYPSQESFPTAHLDLSDTEIQERHPPMTYHVRSDPQQYTLSQGGMSQSHSPHNSPIRRPISRRLISHPPVPQRPAGRPGQGYGKLTFIHRPDVLGNIDTWSLHEQQDNRRIVAFHKEIRGEVIQLDCYPVPAHEYNESMITISCIRWIPSPANELRHKLAGECVFTSVDIILLLEKLVGYSFDVQEKNRIRRNLEGYKPETVKKEGTTRQFFNQVMLYAQPKTRNIEKDIKVFLWKDLAKALKKVMQKYSKRIESANTTPSSQPGISSQALSSSLPNSQPSSSESLPTQRTFMTANNDTYNGTEYDSADYHGNSEFPGETSPHTLMDWQSVLGSGSQFAYSMPLHPPSSVIVDSGTMAGSQMYYSQDESGDTSSMSISPASQITQLGADYGQLMDGNSGSGQQALEAYAHDISGDFAM